MLLAIFCVLSNLTSCSLVIFINCSCIALCKSGKDCSSCCNGAAKVIYGTFKFYILLMNCFCITHCRSGKDFVEALMTMAGEIPLVHQVFTKMVDAHVSHSR